LWVQIFLALFVAAILIISIAEYRAQQDGQWHPSPGRNVVRRWTGSSWQTRPMTPEERWTGGIA
jgi:hypothetical protein